MVLVAQHLRTKQIARKFGTSPDTVDRQIASACRKLGVADRDAAIRLLLAEGGLSAMPDFPAPGPSGMAESADPPPLRETEGVNEQQDLHTDLDVGSASIRTGSAGDGSHTGGDGPLLDQAAGGSGQVPQFGAYAAGNPVRSGLRSRPQFPAALAISEIGTLGRLGIIAAIAVISGLLVAGVLMTAAATMNGLEVLTR